MLAYAIIYMQGDRKNVKQGGMAMSNLKDYIKKMSDKDNDFFFGEGNWTKVSNQYYQFKRVLDNDNIIIITTNIKVIKGNNVLVVDNNKAVYLKDWQVRPVRNWDLGVNAYAVKLNRKYFKPYTFRFSFEDMSFEKEDTFDSLVELAREQGEQNLKFAYGHF